MINSTRFRLPPFSRHQIYEEIAPRNEVNQKSSRLQNFKTKNYFVRTRVAQVYSGEAR